MACNQSSAIILGTYHQGHAVAVHLSGCHVSEFITLILGNAIRPIPQDLYDTTIGITQSTQTNDFRSHSAPLIPNNNQ
jgi:hypothetical protein